MSPEPLRRIRSVVPRPGFRVMISWEQGRPTVVDLSDLISRGGVFAELADERKFSAVRIGEEGTIIEWPEPKDDLGYPVVEIDGNALFLRAEQQQNSAYATTLRTIMDRMKPFRIRPKAAPHT